MTLTARHRIFFLSSCCLVLMTIAHGVHADECDAILEQGVRNTYQAFNSGDMRSRLASGLCQNKNDGSKNATGVDANVAIPIDNVPVKFGGSYKQALDKTSSSGSCGNASSGFDDNTYDFVLQQIASPEIVAAWSQCRQDRGGFIINGKLNGDDLLLEFRFLPVGNVSSTTLSARPTISGATCPADVLVQGSAITNAIIEMQCKRIGTSGITVSANTEFNGANFTIPPIRPTPIATMAHTGRALPSAIPGDPSLTPPPSGKSWCVVPAPSAAPAGSPTSVCETDTASGGCTCTARSGAVFQGTVYE